MMGESVLTVAITTPQSWARQYAIKRRRVSQYPRRNVADLKRLDLKARKAKEEDLQKAVEGQLKIKRSPPNGLQLDPFQTFPIPTAGCVTQMAQYCECLDRSHLISLIMSRSSGLGPSARHCFRLGRPFQSLSDPPLAPRIEV